jgi:hypothetical protein
MRGNPDGSLSSADNEVSPFGRAGALFPGDWIFGEFLHATLGDVETKSRPG